MEGQFAEVLGLPSHEHPTAVYVADLAVQTYVRKIWAVVPRFWPTKHSPSYSFACPLLDSMSTLSGRYCVIRRKLVFLQNGMPYPCTSENETPVELLCGPRPRETKEALFPKMAIFQPTET